MTTNRKIVMTDWRATHPGHCTFNSDNYYTKIANRALKILGKSALDTSFPDTQSIYECALRITGWFEDICSGIGLWKTVNNECQRRYGKLLPFYDCSDYYPGEPNIQDLRLLLWDSLQIMYPDDFVNPENPGILLTAAELFELFDDEYEAAPSTNELLYFITRPEIGHDWLKTREAMEWIFGGSYVFTAGQKTFLEGKQKIHGWKHDAETISIYTYAHKLSLVFRNRQNLLSFTASEWLSAISGRQLSIDPILLDSSYYSIKGRFTNTLLLCNLVNNETIEVEGESFNEAWFNEFGDKKGVIIQCSIAGFNGRWYQIGVLRVVAENSELEQELEEMRNEAELPHHRKNSCDFFYKASKGKDIIFMKGESQAYSFYKKMGYKMNPEQKKELAELIADRTEDGMVAFMASPENGLLMINACIPAIKSNDNPYYDLEYAKENAHSLMVSENYIDYESAILLIEHEMLADASYNSLQGYEHGRALLQDNARFVADYSFSKHQ